jgi:hypothetical protein
MSIQLPLWCVYDVLLGFNIVPSGSGWHDDILIFDLSLWKVRCEPQLQCGLGGWFLPASLHTAN